MPLENVGRNVSMFDQKKRARGFGTPKPENLARLKANLERTTPLTKVGSLAHLNSELSKTPLLSKVNHGRLQAQSRNYGLKTAMIS